MRLFLESEGSWAKLGGRHHSMMTQPPCERGRQTIRGRSDTDGRWEGEGGGEYAGCRYACARTAGPGRSSYLRGSSVGDSEAHRRLRLAHITLGAADVDVPEAQAVGKHP